MDILGLLNPAMPFVLVASTATHHELSAMALVVVPRLDGRLATESRLDGRVVSVPRLDAIERNIG